jgi:molybdopterin synthase catalytic subunit
VTVRVQEGAFDAGAEIAALCAGRRDIGAVASFLGLVRDLGGAAAVEAMTLEHYPGMTAKALEKIVAEAAQRWPLLATRVVHRVGTLAPAEPIVLVAVAAAHRAEAFAACEFIMDALKTRAPFWKKERTPQGARWVDAQEGDTAAAMRWEVNKPAEIDVKRQNIEEVSP